MTEQEYIDASNLARARTARVLLSESLDDSHAYIEEGREAIRKLDTWIERLYGAMELDRTIAQGTVVIPGDQVAEIVDYVFHKVK